MGLWSRFVEGRRTRRVVALLRARMADVDAELAALPVPRQAEALLRAALELARSREEDDAADALVLVRRAVRLAPERADALRLQAALEPADRAVGLLERLREDAPRDLDLALRHAEVLLELDRPRAAADVLLPLREAAGIPALLTLGKALYACDEAEEALEVLDVAMELTDALVQREALSGDITQGDPLFHELRQLHEHVLSEVHGREAVTLDAAHRRRLDARAGVNFKLLAGSMVRARTGAPQRLELEPAAEQRARGKALVRERPGAPEGHLLLGQADLREGSFDRALAHFERAAEADPRHFAAVLGRGAALELREAGAAKAVARLPLSPELDAWGRVVVDLPALTPLERRAVWASVAPFAALRPRLEAAGARIRVLPLDVLATDLPELAELRGERHEGDHRSWDALSGLAADTLAVVKVEELLDVESQGGWTFAHELAHLVLTHAPEQLEAEVRRFHARFERSEHLGTEYQLSSTQEFFACSYVDLLRERHHTARFTEHDDAGQLARLFAFLGDLQDDAPRPQSPARRGPRTVRRG